MTNITVSQPWLNYGYIMWRFHGEFSRWIYGDFACVMKKSPKTHRRLKYGDFYNHRISAAGYSEVISKFTVKQPWPKVGVFTSFPMIL